MTLAETVKALVIEAVSRNGGNKVIAAKQLGISLKTIYNLLTRYGVHKPCKRETKP